MSRRFRVVPLLGWVAAVALTICLAAGVFPASRIRDLGLPGLAILSLLSGAAVEFSGPGLVVVVAYAQIYPPWIVGLVAGAATAVGEYSKYILGRHSREVLPRPLVALVERAERTRLFRFFLRHPAPVLFTLAVFPNPFFDPFLVLAGIRLASPIRTALAVLLGKTARCLLIAYISQMALIGSFSLTQESYSMLSNLLFIAAATFALGCVHWLYDLLAHDQPGSFVLHMTVFAFVSHLAIGVTAGPLHQSPAYYFVLVGILVLLLLQVIAYRSQRHATQRHLRSTLERIANAPHRDAAASWAEMAEYLIGIDFWPQLYRRLGESNPRDERKRGFLRLLPQDRFDLTKLGPEQEWVTALDVPPISRKWRWHAHFWIFVIAWGAHLGYIGWSVYHNGAA